VARESSRVVRCEAFRWRDVERETYKNEGEHFRDITRHTLLGEREGEEDLSFVTRYFEVRPGGYSSLERHEHPHAVVVLRGRGRVILGRRVDEIAPFDCVYVAPGTFHQFHATGDEPLGFLCVVDRVRDRPQAPSDEEFEALTRDPIVRDLARR
jgi:quercetin dioxygenase-like cupin family protein